MLVAVRTRRDRFHSAAGASMYQGSSITLNPTRGIVQAVYLMRTNVHWRPANRESGAAATGGGCAATSTLSSRLSAVTGTPGAPSQRTALSSPTATAPHSFLMSY